jgi:hypothetical protein
MELAVRHDRGAGAGDVGVWARGSIHTHQVIFEIPTGTGSATVVHEGTMDVNGVDGWTNIATFTLSGVASGVGDKSVLQHSWERLRSRCTSLSGTGAKVRSLIGTQRS